MPVFNNIIAGASGATGAAGYEIERSLRFNSADSAHLYRQITSKGNTKTFTFACWLKKTRTGHIAHNIFSGSTGTDTGAYFCIPDNSANALGTADSLVFKSDNDAGGGSVETDAIFRDLSAWYHVVLAVDTTQATASNRVKIWVNGVSQTLSQSASPGYPNQDSELSINDVGHAAIGAEANGSSSSVRFYGSFYLADVHFIDGQALAPTDFGEFDADTGVWNPIEYSGTYGTNGFHLDFSDNSSNAALGTDSSGNSNTWTVNNLSVASGAGNDSLIDTPTNYVASPNNGGNYCTLNPLFAGTGKTFSDGNLETTQTTSNAWRVAGSTFGMSSGKWYWEGEFEAGVRCQFGLITPNENLDNYIGQGSGEYSVAYHFAGSVFYNGTTATTFNSYTVGDIIGVAYDADATTNQVEFFKNGVSEGTVTISNDHVYMPAHCGYAPGDIGIVNFGQRPFAYTPPTGYKSLCTTNLTDPTIADGSTAMDVTLYSGNGSTQTISGLNFSPDLVWIKNRAQADNHKLLDTVRGATNELESNTTGAEVANADGLTAFNSDGFDLGADLEYNTNTESYVSWTWDAGTSTVTNTDGTITSSVRANPSAGFSIIEATISASAQTLGHGLNAKPHMVIRKQKNGTSDWYVAVDTGSVEGYLLLNSTAAITSASQGLTSSVFNAAYLGGSNEEWINYAFAPVEGYSAFGSYTGNGSTDGPFVYTGFRPRFIMYKASSAATGWAIHDSERSEYNVDVASLYPDGGYVEYNGSGHEVDILSNGFKLRNSNSRFNSSGVTYIYAAFAEHPFKTARAR